MNLNLNIFVYIPLLWYSNLIWKLYTKIISSGNNMVMTSIRLVHLVQFCPHHQQVHRFTGAAWFSVVYRLHCLTSPEVEQSLQESLALPECLLLTFHCFHQLLSHPRSLASDPESKTTLLENPAFWCQDQRQAFVWTSSAMSASGRELVFIPSFKWVEPTILQCPIGFQVELSLPKWIIMDFRGEHLY